MRRHRLVATARRQVAAGTGRRGDGALGGGSTTMAPRIRSWAIICAGLFVVYFWVTRGDKHASITVASVDHATTLGADVPESEMALPNLPSASAATLPSKKHASEVWVYAQ